MKKWTTQEKVMLVIIAMFVIGIILRWGFVKSELKETFSGYFGRDSTEVITN